MNKRKVHIFSAFAIFAMLGIILTQVFWVNEAYQFRREQFNQRVRVALKSVSTQMLDLQIDSTARQYPAPCDTIICVKEITEIIHPKLLDSLLRLEMEFMDIREAYRYGVYHGQDSLFIFGDFGGEEPALLASNHQVPLSCIFRKDVYLFSVFFPEQDRIMMVQIILPLSLSVLFLLILLTSFYLIIRMMFRQKRLSQIKTDFINNMTHEFKTPIATIMLSSELLMKPEINRFPYKTRRYASVIYDENARLQKQVEQVLQVSVLEKGQYRLKLQELDLHMIIRRMAEYFAVTVHQRGGTISQELGAGKHFIRGDKVHISNIISNLLDNAIKYSPGQPEITISTRNKPGRMIIGISDKGIGLSHENRDLIFKKLYRVPTGNVHDVKGFGIGLYYVKTMVEAHEGSIGLMSELNKGSTFIVEFPVV